MISPRHKWDRKARVPFAMAAVIVLLLSTASTAYLAGIQRQEAEGRMVSEEIRRQESMVAHARNIMSREVEGIASKAVLAATQFLCNQSMLDSVFQENYSAYLDERFPLYQDPYVVEVGGMRACIFLEEKNLQDLVTGNATREANITLEDGSGNQANETLEEMDTATPQEFRETSELARYVVGASGNCTVRNTLSGSVMRREVSFQRSIDSPFPLMNSKMEALAAGGQEDSMGLARTVRYVLTTLAQFRVMEGYGSGLDSAPGDTGSIITHRDVELALNLALALECARLFRSYDDDALGLVDRLDLGTAGLALDSLMSDYLDNGTLDPADIVALYTGMDTMPLPVDIMLAQALNAIADQFILKYLDYFGIAEAANLVYRTVQRFTALVDEIGGALSRFILGSDGEDRDQARQVRDWLSKLSGELDWPPSASNITGNGMTVDEGAGKDCLAVLNPAVAVEDVMELDGVYVRLVEETVSNITSSGETIGTHHVLTLEEYNISAVSVPSHASAYPGGYLVDFMPVSMTRPDADLDATWSLFHQEHYGSGEDEIYESIREAVKAVTEEMAAILTMFVEQQDLTLAGFMGGAHAVGPGDRTSVLESVDSVILEAVDQAVERIRQEPALLSMLLSSLTSAHSQMILDLMSFIGEHYDELADRELQMDAGLTTLARSVLLNSSMYITPVGEYTAEYSQYNELGHYLGYEDEPAVEYNSTGPPDAGIGARMLTEQNRAGLQENLSDHVSSAYETMREQETAWYYAGSPDNGLFVKALEGALAGQPGKIAARFLGTDPDTFISLGAGMIRGVLEGMMEGGDMANIMYAPLMAYASGQGLPFELYDGEQGAAGGNVWRVNMSIVMPTGAITVVPVSDIAGVDGLLPGQVAVCIGEPRGVHYTDVASFSTRPFETCWNISLLGSVPVILESNVRPYLDAENSTHAPARLDREININLNMPVVVYSGWDLAGVEYDSTSTLAGDIKELLDLLGDFLGWVWDTISGPIDWLVDQIMKVVDFFADILGTLLSYASDAMNMVVDLIDYAVELVQDFLRDIAGWVFDSIIGWILDLLPDGLEFGFSAFGFTFRVMFASKEEMENASSGSGGLLMSIDTSGSILGAGFGLGMEMHALPDAVASTVDMNYDIILRSGMEIGGFTLNTTIDPFMALQEHLVECRGLGAGWGLELVIPEVEAYDSVSYSLHDIPGVGAALSNIPIPFLGLKASVNAGLDIKYTLRGLEEDNVIINEVELNPRGVGEGQWVELYNPTSGPVDLGGWSLDDGQQSITLENGTCIGPGEYMVLEGPDSGWTGAGTTLMLHDALGNMVDTTPALSDADGGMHDTYIVPPGGSQMSWQRVPNGANFSINGGWEFAPATRGSENPGKNITFRELVWALLRGAFTTTWDELEDQIALSLDFIVELVTRFIQHFIDDVLRVVERSVVETSLFLDVMFTDMSGSAGAGMALSFVVEGGDTLASILRWVIDSVAAFLEKFGKPTQPARYPSLDPGVPEHLFVRLEFYGLVGVPSMISSAAGLSGDQEEMQIKLTGRIEANIPALAALVGRDMGRWRINFGVYVDDMPSAIADPLFGTGEDVEPDVWLFRGCVFEM